MWCEATLSKRDGAWWRIHFTYGLIIGANFPLQQFWNCSGMCRTGQALFNHESHTYTLMTPERGHIREHAISCKGHWSRDCCSLHVQCFILGSITAGGGKGSCFWTIKGFQRQLLSCGGIHTPSCAVSELHVSSFTFCTLSSERLLPFWFLLFNLHLSYRIRENKALCSVTFTEGAQSFCQCDSAFVV